MEKCLEGEFLTSFVTVYVLNQILLLSLTSPLPSASLHLYSSKEKQSCHCPIEKTVISFHYLVHTTFLNENIERRKPNLVHDLQRPLDMQQPPLHQKEVRAAEWLSNAF